MLALREWGFHAAIELCLMIQKRGFASTARSLSCPPASSNSKYLLTRCGIIKKEIPLKSPSERFLLKITGSGRSDSFVRERSRSVFSVLFLRLPPIDLAVRVFQHVYHVHLLFDLMGKESHQHASPFTSIPFHIFSSLLVVKRP
jgi:hypothetical protein